MYRQVLATVLLLGALSGCRESLGTCGPNRECEQGGVCDVERGLCYTLVEAELDGGACTPACAPYEACTSRGCAPRYAALTVTPGDGGVVGAGPVAVQAELVVRPGVAANFPETLDLRVVRSDGGAGGTLTAGARAEGVYPAQWTPPGDGVFLLTAAYPRSGGPSTTVHLTADTTPPTFTVTVPTADAGGAVGSTSYADPSLPMAWRRDQVVPVEIRTNEPSFDSGTLTVVLRTDGGTGSTVNVVAFTQGASCDAGFCGVARMNLWEPPFDAFRGQMAVEVRGQDRVGNVGTSSGVVNVTRWKWRHDITGATITATPALGNTGVVYVGTTNGSDNDGQLLALSPGGRVLWAASGGAVVASPTVGNVQDGGVERVYAAVRKGSISRVGFFDSADGGFTAVCNDVNSISILVQSSLAFTQLTAGSASETVYGVYSGRTGGTIFAIRPDAENDLLLRCPSTAAVGDVVVPGTMLATGNAVVFGSSDGRLKSYALDTTGTSFTLQWNQPLVAVANDPSTLLQPSSLAAASGAVYGGGNLGGFSKFFSAPLDGGQPPSYFPTASVIGNPSVGNVSGNVAVAGLENARLVSLTITDGGTQSIDTAGEVIRSAPVWGANGYIYTGGATSGAIQARKPLGTVAWQFEPGFTIGGSLTLDCNRQPEGSVIPGLPGVLYAATRDGKVHALVVDSRGLDTSAPWPKYQHDARNTGNPSTPISSCP